MKVAAGLACNSYCTWFIGMLELPMAASLAHKMPAVIAQQS